MYVSVGDVYISLLLALFTQAFLAEPGRAIGRDGSYLLRRACDVLRCVPQDWDAGNYSGRSEATEKDGPRSTRGRDWGP